MNAQEKKKAIWYLEGVIEGLIDKAGRLNARLMKAEEMGCNNPKNKFFETYLTIKNDYEKTKMQIVDYEKSLAKAKANEI